MSACRAIASVAVLVVCAVPCLAENARQLTLPLPGYSDAWPVYSPRGDKVAFGRLQHGVGMLTTVFVADVSTGSVDSLVTGLPAAWNPNGGLEWSPDGRQIAFMSDTPGVGSAVWVADVPGPVVPRVLAFTGSGSLATFYAVASDGNLYSYATLTGVACDPLVNGRLVGNMFNGPPPSRVVDIGIYNDGVWVCLQNGDIYAWCVTSNQGVFSGNIFNAAGVSAVGQAPPRIANGLFSGRPNPFNPATRIPYTLATGGRVAIRVYDVSGRLVRTIADERKPPGAHTATWGGETDGGTQAGSGTYFLRITYPDGASDEQKVTVLK